LEIGDLSFVISLEIGDLFLEISHIESTPNPSLKMERLPIILRNRILLEIGLCHFLGYLFLEISAIPFRMNPN